MIENDDNQDEEAKPAAAQPATESVKNARKYKIITSKAPKRAKGAARRCLWATFNTSIS